MARRPRASALETRTSRLKLAVRRKPYAFTTISPGIALGYRRNHDAGTWVVRVADGAGSAWTKRVGLADDHEDADGTNVLSWWEAIEAARKLARGSSNSGRPATVADAVEAYGRDLVARGSAVANAGKIRKHLTPTLASKPVGLLTARELTAWRDGLLAGGKLKRASVRRTCKAFAAALSLTAKRDPRITNEKAWRHGLGGIGETFGTRNAQVLSDTQIHSLVAAAYVQGGVAFGLYIETAAHSGARLSQIAALNVADLQNGGEPRLMMPCSRKGRGRRTITHKPVPITSALAAKLKASAAGRAPDAPLLLRVDGLRWQTNDLGDHLVRFRKAAIAAGAIVDGKPVTVYALRHSSIVRSLLAGVPARVVAACADTSLAELEKTYSAYIADHADAIARRGLLAPTVTDAKVVPLAGRRS